MTSLILNSIVQSLSGEDYLSLSFLDETHIALSRSTYEATPILTTGTVHLFDLKSGDPEDGSSFTDITLRLPRTTMNGWAYWNVEVVCDPAPIRSSYPSSEVPFHVNPDNRVVAIRARAAQMLWGGAIDLDFFITSKTLLSFFDGIKQGEGDDLDWDEWGPTNARILPSISKQMWCYPVHGSRAIGIHGRNLVIHDFNQKALRKFGALKDIIKDEGVITNTPATDHGLQMYPQDIYHRLPFARHNTNIGGNTRKGLMISEDSLVLVDVSCVTCLPTLGRGSPVSFEFTGRGKEFPSLFNLIAGCFDSWRVATSSLNLGTPCPLSNRNSVIV